MEQPPDTFRSPSRPAVAGVRRRRSPLVAVAVLGTALVSGAAGALLVTAGGGADDARLTAAADRSSSAPSSPDDTTGTAPADVPPTAPPAPGAAPAGPTTSPPAGRTTKPARNRVTTTPPRTTAPPPTTKRPAKRTTTRTTTRTRTRTTPPRTTTKTSSAAPSGSLAQQVLDLTNAERRAAGCTPLAWDATLAKVAQAHSEDMRDNDFFAHESQDGRSPFDRMKNAGYAFRTAAENIAAGQPTPKAVMDSWMNSAGHRANILNCSLTELGVGIAKGGSYGIYWTQDFGTPA